MKQQDFIFVMNNLDPIAPPVQDEFGNTTAMLNNSIKVTHNYKKNDLTVIHLLSTEDIYQISSRQELEAIASLHLEHKNPNGFIKAYCDGKLKKLQ